MALIRFVALARRSPLFALEKPLLGEISFSSMAAFLLFTSRGSCSQTGEVRKDSFPLWMAVIDPDAFEQLSLALP